MTFIPFTNNMRTWLTDACKQAKTNKKALSKHFGWGPTYLSMKRPDINGERWGMVLNYFKEKDIEPKVDAKKRAHKVKDTDQIAVFDRFRAMAAEPGATAMHLCEVFKISKSSYQRLIQGHNGTRVLPKLVKGFAKIDGDVKKLTQPKVEQRVSTMTLGQIIDAYHTIKELSDKLPKKQRTELLQLLLAEK